VILQLDIGNTCINWRLRLGDESVDRGSLPRAGTDLLPALTERPGQVWVASVAGEHLERQLRDALQQAWDLEPWVAGSSASACGVTNSYAEPGRMGVDRWLAMIAAWSETRGDVCVVDAGSALTIDFVAEDGRHRGGYILPGLDSMERALLQDTDRVRFGDAPRQCLEPGQSTEAAVYNGLQLSQVGAVALALDRFGAGCRLYFCGGKGAEVQGLLDRGGECRAELVLDGLELLGREQLAPGQGAR